MSLVLRNQIEAAQKSAQELDDELHRTHRWAMLCFDVRDLARSAVNLLGEINGSVDRWQQGYAGHHPGHEELAPLGEVWDGLYRSLAGVFEKTAGLIRAMEKEGFPVEDKARFMSSWRDLRGITCFSRDGVALAVEQLRRGEGQSLGDFERELRDHPIY
jgi:hypothetical protein